MIKNTVRTILLIGLIVMVIAAYSAEPVFAVNAVVGTGTPASCTEDAFNAALATVLASGSGTLTFNCGNAATITFTAGKVITAGAFTIDGGSHITLSGTNNVRHFYVEATANLTLKNITLTNGFDNTYGGGSILSLGELTLQNATIRDSNVDSGHSGGAIMAYKQVTITDGLIENNTGGSVGGLFLFGESADATITGSTFRNNRTTSSAYGLGGALTTWDGADVVINNSTFDQNQAKIGGAIYNESAATTIVIAAASVFNTNQATLSGGGIYNGAGIVTVMNTTFSSNNSLRDGGAIFSRAFIGLTDTVLRNNTANYSGGGIYNTGFRMTLKDTLLNNNTANDGGSIFQYYGVMFLSNVTISGNSAADKGGGIYDFSSTGFLTNVTFSGNSALTGGGIAAINGATIMRNVILDQGLVGTNCDYGAFTSFGFNLSSDASCVALNQAGDQINTDPMLGPLADNGGPTLTHLPQMGSPALDSGQCTTGILRDQRGIIRPQGVSCDKGAVEGYTKGGLLYNNGPLFNIPNGGLGPTDTGHTDLSTIQSGLDLTLFGFFEDIAGNNSVADDFIIPPGEKWRIDTMTFFSYQSGSSTQPAITGVNATIYNGNPSAGGTVIGNSSNLVSTKWTGGYRVNDLFPDDTTHPIMASVVDFGGLVLNEGTYWVEWQKSALPSDPWAVPITINGQTTTGNGVQKVTGIWREVEDNGYPQGFPFIINGTNAFVVYLPLVTKP